MTTITITQLYQLLSERTDAKTAEALTSYIAQKVEAEIMAQKEVLSTKEDITLARAEIRTEIQQAKVDMLKWFVGLFMALALMIIGLYLK